MRRAPLVASTLAAVLGIVILAHAGLRSTHSSGTEQSGKVRSVPIMGGSDYFAKKDPQDAWMDHTILLGAWSEQPQNAADVRRDRQMGQNIYWSLGGTAGDPSDNVANYNVIRAGGMHVITQSSDSKSGAETAGYQGFDEADLVFGPGWANAKASGSSAACVPSKAKCGFTVARFFYTGQPASIGKLPYTTEGTIINQGFGKGVLFWEVPQQAATFLRYSDILSADSYWMIDNSLSSASQGGCAFYPKSQKICERGGGKGLTLVQSRLAANYAYNVTRLAQLEKRNGASKPIVVDVETGCPSYVGGIHGNCATPTKSVAAAWHALIAGARGIIWFQHNFSGPCRDDRTFADGSNPSSKLYDCVQTPGVTLHDLVLAITRFDHRVQHLSPVLLSSTLVNYVSTRGDVSTLAKAYRGRCYIFAAAGRPGHVPQQNEKISFQLSGGFTGKVSVLGSSKSLRASHGHFSDVFQTANTVRIYTVAQSGLCATGA
jgi:hypothetical protein